MQRSKLRFLVFTALVLACVPAVAAPVGEISVLTDYFYRIPYGGQICADIDPDVAGVPVTFKGVTPWSITRTTGPALTNVFGTACTRVIWPEGIYALTASTDGLTSDPVAIAFWNPSYFCGAISTGELHLHQYGFNSDYEYTQDYRVATAAMIYRKPSPLNRSTIFAALYYDLDNPAGAVTFSTRSFQQVQSGTYYGPDGPYDYTELVGAGYFQQGAGPKMIVRYDLYVDNYPNDNFFCLEIYDLTGKLIYENDYCHLYKGKTEVNLCLPK